MRTKQKIRLCVDFVMVILMPCPMAYAFMGGKLHEWLGLAMVFLAVSSVILSGYAPWNIKGSMAVATELLVKMAGNVIFNEKI